MDNTKTSVATPKKSSFKIWIQGARPKTLPAAIAPVILGTTLALTQVLGIRNANGECVVLRHQLIFSFFILALIVGVALQIGVNYANDYSDGIKGSDANRVGPTRLVASGLATAKAVKRAAFISFGIAGVSGLILSINAKSMNLIYIGAIAIAAAWFYTGGKKPYGYQGFGEISVFLFFGLVATVGSYYIQTHNVTIQSYLCGAAMGFFAVSILLVNNLRDLDSDKLVGKNTLAVRLGDVRTRTLLVVFITMPYVIAILLVPTTPLVLLTFISLVLYYISVNMILTGATGKELVKVLTLFGLQQLSFAVLAALAFIVKGLS